MQIAYFDLFVHESYVIGPLMHDDGVKILLCMICLTCFAHEETCDLLN